MKCAFLLFASIVLTAGCTGQRAGIKEFPQEASLSAAKTEAHGFKVNLMLSDIARRKLIEAKETIIVAGYITGTPKKNTPKKYIDEIGSVDLGAITAEVSPGEAATFGEVKLPRAKLLQTEGEDPELLINVFSGRKSSKDNLLDCGIYKGSFNAVQGRSMEIACRLIGEKSS